MSAGIQWIEPANLFAPKALTAASGPVEEADSSPSDLPQRSPRQSANPELLGACDGEDVRRSSPSNAGSVDPAQTLPLAKFNEN